MQPRERVAGELLLKLTTLLDWEVLHCSGVNGFLSVVFALLSWGLLSLSSEQKEKWVDAVVDVTWVLEKLVRGTHTPSPGSSPSPGSTTPPGRKRQASEVDTPLTDRPSRRKQRFAPVS